MGTPRRVRLLAVLAWTAVLGAIAWFAMPYVAAWLRPQAPPPVPLIVEPVSESP
jgi:hypothetical protein